MATRVCQCGGVAMITASMSGCCEHLAVVAVRLALFAVGFHRGIDALLENVARPRDHHVRVGGDVLEVSPAHAVTADEADMQFAVGTALALGAEGAGTKDRRDGQAGCSCLGRFANEGAASEFVRVFHGVVSFQNRERSELACFRMPGRIRVRTGGYRKRKRLSQFVSVAAKAGRPMSGAAGISLSRPHRRPRG